MNTPVRVFLAAAIVFVIGTAVAYAWWAWPSAWATTTWAQGSSPSFAPKGDAPSSRLRFRNAAFTVMTADGTARSFDVTPVLNGMAVAYASPPKGGAAPPAITLIAPLNPYSFTIAGFNDSATVPDHTVGPLVGATASLTASYRTI